MVEVVELPKFEAEKRHPLSCKMGGERKLEGRSTDGNKCIEKYRMKKC